MNGSHGEEVAAAVGRLVAVAPHRNAEPVAAVRARRPTRGAEGGRRTAVLLLQGRPPRLHRDLPQLIGWLFSGKGFKFPGKWLWFPGKRLSRERYRGEGLQRRARRRRRRGGPSGTPDTNTAAAVAARRGGPRVDALLVGTARGILGGPGNGRHSIQLCVVVFDTCLVWEMLMLPSDALASPNF